MKPQQNQHLPKFQTQYLPNPVKDEILVTRLEIYVNKLRSTYQYILSRLKAFNFQPLLVTTKQNRIHIQPLKTKPGDIATS